MRIIIYSITTTTDSADGDVIAVKAKDIYGGNAFIIYLQQDRDMRVSLLIAKPDLQALAFMTS